ncbi:MAG TPA: hypothetical protein PK349_13120, partial [Candidatus Hydrogenedentes bacterium]|nr:hypothetical protein [Candidatus Hydrogenedentota bacterium]
LFPTPVGVNRFIYKPPVYYNTFQKLFEKTKNIAKALFVNNFLWFNPTLQHGGHAPARDCSG